VFAALCNNVITVLIFPGLVTAQFVREQPSPPHPPRACAGRHTGAGAGGENGIAKMWNRRDISASSYYDQSHHLHPHPYIWKQWARRRCGEPLPTFPRGSGVVTGVLLLLASQHFSLERGHAEPW
jgi:hypothetical protein